MAFRVVSYSTEGTLYDMIMGNYLYPSLSVLGVKHFVEFIGDSGSWETNIMYQPQVIWKSMRMFENENIVWMDSDILLNDYPYLFDDIPARCDIGLYYLKYEDHWGEKSGRKETPKPVLNTGVLYFHNTPKMQDFVYEWMTLCAQDPKKNHREHLSDLIDKKIRDDLSIFLLPRSYNYIAVREDGNQPAVVLENPVVMHFQASIQTRKNLYGNA